MKTPYHVSRCISLSLINECTLSSPVPTAVEEGAGGEESEDEEEEDTGEGQKLRLTSSGILVPLGWPKVFIAWSEGGGVGAEGCSCT